MLASFLTHDDVAATSTNPLRVLLWLCATVEPDQPKDVTKNYTLAFCRSKGKPVPDSFPWPAITC